MVFKLKKRKSEQVEEALEDVSNYAEIEQRLGYAFKDHALLELGLTHRSVFSKSGKSDYERLEFLGDAVLDLVVAHLLIDRYPLAKEGELSKMRAALVNTSSLAQMALKLDLPKYVRLSKGEHASGGAERPSILADVFEALIGAVYKEAGFDLAYSCVEKLMQSELCTVIPRDPKTELQEVLHALGKEAPLYKLECVEGPEHAPSFVSIVEVDGQIVGRGKGNTKKASQQEAAAEALEKYSADDSTESDHAQINVVE